MSNITAALDFVQNKVSLKMHLTQLCTFISITYVLFSQPKFFGKTIYFDSFAT